jgi:hypothetical protein
MCFYWRKGYALGIIELLQSVIVNKDVASIDHAALRACPFSA